ncbi:MAG: hypothetical protein L3K15_04945 [Thermoplasmata archaeon]|nr:hypothetical protein [Thermoplasmata archaeon]
MVRTVALELLRARSRPFPSQVAFAAEIVGRLQRVDPGLVVGGARLRRILLETTGVVVRVRYGERAGPPASDLCPVCRSPLRRIPNRTLEGGTVTVGYRCPRCGYWTHLRRRVPVRYIFERSRGRRESTPSSRATSGSPAARSTRTPT